MFQGLRAVRQEGYYGCIVYIHAHRSLRIDASLAVYSPRGQKCSISDSLLHISLFCCLCLQFVPSGGVIASSPFHQLLAIPIVDFNC